ncbi:MAG: hypothetical protein JWM80_598 [Cyanobacteria bacterium RYN_339]|nr:hypothetical protein [Cyanobacteria bacterium RYN_339]
MSEAGKVSRPQRAASGIAEAFSRLGDASRWTRVAEVPLAFKTFHPQGMVKVGNEYWMSSVEVKGGWLTRILHALHLAPERGTGHLFRFDQQGKLLGDLKLGSGAMFHAGGIDFDGKYLWIPVAEYRANSNTLVYRVDPATLKAEVAFQFPDHLGALAVNPETNTLYAGSWSAEKLYSWQLNEQGELADPGAAPKMTYNDGRSVDYQDMHHVDGDLVLASGYRGFHGGIDLVDMKTRMPVHQVQVPVRVGAFPITRNPFFCEQVGGKLQFTFVPQDNKSSLFVYEVDGD